jgi:succinate dehydrogenase hydrophobic anchor subunit
MVIIDYVHRPRLRVGLLASLYVLGIVLLIIGTEVIISLPMPGAEAGLGR